MASNGAEELLVVTGLYIAGMVLSVPLILVNAFLPIELRLIVWAGFGILWMVALWLVGRSPVAFSRGLIPTDSLVERFGLFTIIVLGESVVSVAAGISGLDFELASSLVAAGTFVIAASLWWLYFDCVTEAVADSARYVYVHFLVYAGLGAVAPGALLAILGAHHGSLSGGARAALCGGHGPTVPTAHAARRSPGGWPRSAWRARGIPAESRWVLLSARWSS